MELAALDPGELPYWADARTYVDALLLEEIEDDLFELCGVDPAKHPRDTWLAMVKERLLSDLGRFRADGEGDHDEIEEWDFRGGRIFASDPDVMVDRLREQFEERVRPLAVRARLRTKTSM